MSDLTEAAKVAFSSEFAFYLKAHNYHWNIESLDFFEYHELFGKIYEEVLDHIDNFAEKIRSLDAYVPGSFSKFSVLSQIEDENGIPDQTTMVKVLLNDSDQMVKILKVVYDLAEQEGEHGFSNFLAERMDAHRTHSWMLRASIKRSNS